MKIYGADLPANNEPSGISDTPPVPSTLVPIPAVKLLIVDDEPDIVNEMHEYLSEVGFDCDFAYNAHQALEKIHASPETGVILADIVMPGISGIEMTRRLRLELPEERELEVIILTGYAGQSEAIEALRAGAMNFLTKPIKLEDLRISVNRAIELVRMRRADRLHKEGLEQELDKERKISKFRQNIIAIASHEFRTPLTIIDSAAQRLVRHNDLCTPEKLLERSQTIRGAVERMNHFVESNLCMSQLESGDLQCKFQRCNLTSLINAAVSRQSKINPGREFTVSPGAFFPIICADPTLIDMVFSNLLSNSDKYSSVTSAVDIRSFSDGDFAMISFTDYGIGIPEDEMGSLFKRFFRARTAEGFPGTGIGLSLSKEITDLHGGTIGVTSSEGVGSTFTVRLPIKAPCHLPDRCAKKCHRKEQ